MTVSAPRLDARIVERLERLASGSSSPAEIRRVLVVQARELRLAPPCYEHVRRLVTLRRLEASLERESAILPLIVDVALGVEHGTELLRVARGERRRPR